MKIKLFTGCLGSPFFFYKSLARLDKSRVWWYNILRDI